MRVRGGGRGRAEARGEGPLRRRGPNETAAALVGPEMNQGLTEEPPLAGELGASWLDVAAAAAPVAPL